MSDTIKEQFAKDILGESSIQQPPIITDAPLVVEASPVVEEVPIVTATTNTPSPVVDLNSLSDEALLELLSKRNIQVPREKTEEERAQDEKNRRSAILAYGLKNKKVSAEEYDTYQKLSLQKDRVVLDEVREAIAKANPDMDAEEIEDKLNEYTFAHLDDTDIRKQLRKQEIETLAENKLRNKYKNIYNLPSEYAIYENSENENKNLQRKIEAGLPVYQNDINTILNGLKEFTEVIEDKENDANNISISYTFADGDIEEVKSALFSKEEVEKRIKNGYDVKDIKNEIETYLITKNRKNIIAKAAKDYNSKQKENYIRGLKGEIPSGGGILGSLEQPLQISDVKSKFAADIKAQNNN